jgi:hypothetical protein
LSVHRERHRLRAYFGGLLVGANTYPETSLTISRTKAVRLLKCPFMREMRCFG